MRAAILSFVGPAIVAVAVWCALGEVTVATPDGATTRLAVPASLWWLPAAFVAAWWVRPWRRMPSLAAPALIATVPWWPVPLPAIALLWTGRLAWVPIGLAIAVAAAERARGGTRPSNARPSGPYRPAVMAGLATLCLAVGVAWSIGPRLPAGDEPHYLVITQSLLLDGDLRIANNHDRRDYASYFGGTIRPDRIRDGQNGEVYSIHAPGTSVLVLPGFAAFGYRGAQATIVLLASVTGALIWLVGWLASGDQRAAWFAWAGVTLSATFLVQATSIFPDGPGAFVTAAAACVILSRADRGAAPTARMLVATGALLATLPWLHSRFAILAAGLAVLVASRVIGASGVNGRERIRLLMAASAVPLISAAGWFSYFQVIYGTPSPSAPYGPNPETHVAYVPGGMLGLLFDQQFGLMIYAPAMAAAAVGFSRQSRDRGGRFGAGLAVAALAYIAVVGIYWMWWAGVPATPARFATAALPLLAAPMALGWRRSGPTARAIWNLLLVATVAMTAIVLGTGRGALAWNYRSSRTEWLDWLASSADLARGWPSFFWQLTPGQVQTEWPFAVHVATWLAVLAILAVVTARVTTATLRLSARPMQAAAWWLITGLMMAVQSGWWLTARSGVDASGPQMAMLRRAAEGVRPVRISPFVWRPESSSVPALRIRVRRSDVDAVSRKGWLPLHDVPAGRYQLWAENASSSRGSVTVRTEDALAASFVVEPKARKAVRFELPSGASVLTLEPDAPLAASPPVIELIAEGH